MAGILDFFSDEAGQRRRASLDELGRDIGYYVPPELRGILGLVAEMTPTATMDRAGTAAREMASPGLTPMARVGAAGTMLSETAGMAAPLMVAGRAAMPAAQALEEALLGVSMGADDVARQFVTDESGALRLIQPRTAGERFIMRGDAYFNPADPTAGRRRDPAMFSPFSSTKHTTAPHDFFVAGTDLGGLRVPDIVAPEDLKRLYDRMYFATGDRTSANRAIEEINDIILRDPTITYGGPEYMDQLRAWASEPTAMAAKANALQELPEGLRAVLAYMPMGERSGDFSKHMSDVYGAATQATMAGNRGPGAGKVSAIDELIASKFPGLKSVPSVASEAFPTWLSGLKGGQRAKLIKAFDAADFKALGMPDVSAVRFAVTNPDLVNADALSVGYRMSAPDASGGIIRSTEHPSYGAYLPMMPETTNMTLGYDVPWWIGARDTALQKIRPGGATYALPKDIKSYMGNPRIYQDLDQQWVDETSTYGGLLATEGKEAADRYAIGLLENLWMGQ
jgi:hypothetical protein